MMILRFLRTVARGFGLIVVVIASFFAIVNAPAIVGYPIVWSGLVQCADGDSTFECSLAAGYVVSAVLFASWLFGGGWRKT